MIRSGDRYRRSIRDGREVYVNAERVKDVPTHPLFRPLVDIRACLFDMADEPAHRDTMPQVKDGEINAVGNALPYTQDDRWAKRRATDGVLVTRAGDETVGENSSLFDGQDVLNEVEPQCARNIENHMSSVSADSPRPTLLVCVHRRSQTAGAILANGVFCAEVLRDDQAYSSDVFAGRLGHSNDDKFVCATWTTQSTGAPRVLEPFVAFDCRLTSHNLVATRHVFFAELEGIHVGGHGSPLIYANRAMRRTRKSCTWSRATSSACDPVCLAARRSWRLCLPSMAAKDPRLVP